MIKSRPLAVILLAYELFCFSSLGFIYRALDFGDQNNEISLFLDLHYVASKEQNLKQLDYLIKELEAIPGPVHLIIESKFFYDLENNQDLASFFEKLSYMLGQEEDYSFSNSPQDASATTFIAWELPLKLLNMRKPKLSYEFCDPRLKLDGLLDPRDAVAEVTELADHALQQALRKSSPHIMLEISKIFELETKSPESQIFDKILTSKMLRLSHEKSASIKKRTIAICGASHGQMLATQVMPLLGFKLLKSKELPLSELRVYKNGAALDEPIFRRSCELLGLNKLSSQD